MEAIKFLLDFVFDTYVMILILRVWLQLVRADFYNPISQFIVKVTNPLVLPFRRLIPGFGGIDVATIVVAIIISIAKWAILQVISGGSIDLTLTAWIGFLAVIKQAGFLLFMIMLIMALMSWVVQGYNPTLALFNQLTEPVLRPIRKLLPSIGGLDLSVLVAFLAMNVINILLSGAIPYWQAL
jgi:YggT family protein